MVGRFTDRIKFREFVFIPDGAGGQVQTMGYATVEENVTELWANIIQVSAGRRLDQTEVLSLGRRFRVTIRNDRAFEPTMSMSVEFDTKKHSVISIVDKGNTFEILVQRIDG